jgi:alpha-ketoglutarate-dependent taurine dioxygenase
VAPTRLSGKTDGVPRNRGREEMMEQVMAKFSIEPVKEHIGGVVHIAKEDMLDDDFIAAVQDAMEDRSVLAFPKLNLSDEEQLAFTDKLGPRVNFTKRVPGSDASEKDVYKITLDKKINREPEYVLGTYFWHIDGVTIDQPLPKYTLLSARKLSETGGQTEFASTYAAYEGLPQAEKDAIERLKVVHKMEASMRPVFDDVTDEQLAKWRDMASIMVHPLVWNHRSGRKSLVLGSHADRVEGMGLPDGRSLIARLIEWAAQPAYSYRHEWQEGDFVIWDNTGSMHRVVPYDASSGRTMHRTTIMGDERVA